MAETAEASKPPARAGHSAPERPGLRLPRLRLRRWVLGAVAVPALSGAGLWIAVHRIPWMGPLVANGLRSVIGAENVTALEETAYAVEDRVQRLWRRNEPPKTYWEVPEQPAPAAAAAPTMAATSGPAAGGTGAAAFRPTDVGPSHAAWSAPGGWKTRWLKPA